MPQDQEWVDINGEPMVTTRDWSLWAKICAGVILITGLGLIALGITKWGGYLIAVGTLFTAVALFGLFVAYKQNKQLAKLYYYALVLTTILSILLLTQDISSVSDWVNDHCRDNHLDDNACTTERITKWIFSIVGFIVCITSCCLCIFCASAYSHSFSDVQLATPTKVKKKKKKLVSTDDVTPQGFSLN
eukprot:TRINITY_DN8686_c0_g1_i1.p1 TRINITY_DN8686_c0_g1~~TRINITY_DN8686_c0_g1_i1.p1  ORF type:complete len:189 (+),score=28.69 TRINITY_DN8686_c0_g1_i1:13-579(+)